LPLCLKTFEEGESKAPPFLTMSLDGWEWSALCSGHFIAGERGSSNHWIGGWVGHRTGMDTKEKRKSLAPARNWTPVIQPVTCCYTNWAVPVPINYWSRNSTCINMVLSQEQKHRDCKQLLVLMRICKPMDFMVNISPQYVHVIYIYIYIYIYTHIYPWLFILVTKIFTLKIPFS
jgi:hypothetical protein